MYYKENTENDNIFIDITFLFCVLKGRQTTNMSITILLYNIK